MPLDLQPVAARETAHAPLRGIRNGQKETVRYDDVSFGDVMEMFNPLNHIPIVSGFYSRATGTQVNPAAKIIGGTIMGGVVGFALATFNAMFEETTGKGMIAAVGDAVIGSPSTNVAAAPRQTEIANAHMRHTQRFSTFA